MASYYDEYIKQNRRTTEQMIAERQKANTNISNQYVQDVNAIVDNATDQAVNKVQGEIDKLPASYQSVFDTNAIQEKINERQVKARMSDLGLTDSGLNRTQQTAISLQRSNADAATRQQINATTASLKQQIADLYISGEKQKAENAATAKKQLLQQNQDVYNNYMDNLYSNATSYENARIEADSEAATKEAEWYRDNGYALDDKGNWIYVGNPNGKTFNLDNYSEVYDEAVTLYDPDSTNGGTAFLNYLERLESMGYSATAIDQLVSEVIADDGERTKKEKNDFEKNIFNLLKNAFK